MEKTQVLVSLNKHLISSLQDLCLRQNLNISEIVEDLVSEYMERVGTEMEIATKKTDASVEIRKLNVDEIFSSRLIDLIGPDVDSITITVKRNDMQTQFENLFQELFAQSEDGFVSIPELQEHLANGWKNPKVSRVMAAVGFVSGQKIDQTSKGYREFSRYLTQISGVTKDRKCGIRGFKGLKCRVLDE